MSGYGHGLGGVVVCFPRPGQDCPVLPTTRLPTWQSLGACSLSGKDRGVKKSLRALYEQRAASQISRRFSTPLPHILVTGLRLEESADAPPSWRVVVRWLDPCLVCLHHRCPSRGLVGAVYLNDATAGTLSHCILWTTLGRFCLDPKPSLLPLPPFVFFYLFPFPRQAAQASRTILEARLRNTRLPTSPRAARTNRGLKTSRCATLHHLL